MPLHGHALLPHQQHCLLPRNGKQQQHHQQIMTISSDADAAEPANSSADGQCQRLRKPPGHVQGTINGAEAPARLH
jgi:hypothetical protein